MGDVSVSGGGDVPVDQPVGCDKRLLIGDLCDYLEGYLSSSQVNEVWDAFCFSAEAHETQKRQSGEPYIYHPIAVTKILAEMRMDQNCLMAAMLHDVLEDTEVTKAQLAERYGDEVAELVDGVTKLGKMDFKSKAEAQAANFRKMLLAVAKDIRVIIIKLADRLHNMRTLGAMRLDKRRRIAKETLEIYAPIANRFGINSLRLELERLGFQSYWPYRYKVIRSRLDQRCGNRDELIAHTADAFRLRLQQEGIKCQVSGREKNPYSIYKKMRDKKLPFDEMVDVYGFRIVVDTVDTCYRALGVVHNLYKPKPGGFKDYIAIPKANGYQSLHTILIGPQGQPIEIQIRTEDMHQLAESGIAAHWAYKSNSDSKDKVYRRAAEWLSSLLDSQGGIGDSIEFLEHVKIDLFPDEVYVFTPRGDIKVLPKRATILDFAYAVHTDVGNRCVGARVDRRYAPLRSRLFNGQTVEILTRSDAAPNPSWLNFVVTSKARAHIRSYLKNMKQQEAVAVGRRLLEHELQSQEQRMEDISAERLRLYMGEVAVASFDELLADIGLGNRMAQLVVQHLTGSLKGQAADQETRSSTVPEPLVIKGTEGMVVHFGKCCRPIPGDEITAVFNPGKGLVVHRQECPNLERRAGTAWLDVAWQDGIEGDFSSEIRVAVGNQRGVLATVAAAIAETGSNIENVSIDERDGLTSTLNFVIEVKNRKHLANVMRRVRALPKVMRIFRSGRSGPGTKGG